MESNKTEVLSFDIDEYNSRECQVHNHGFYLGEQSKQAEVDELIDTIKTSAESEMYLFDELQKVKGERDELQKKYDAMYNAFVVADDCRQEWHRCYVGVRQREDDLQKRIDNALMWCEKGCVLKAMEILKGEETK